MSPRALFVSTALKNLLSEVLPEHLFVSPFLGIYCSTRQGGEGAGGRLASLTALQQSMLLLAESLDSGAIGGQFEQLYRRNQGLAITECHLPANAAKNRRVSILF
jgi:hypothetical protein